MDTRVAAGVLQYRPGEIQTLDCWTIFFSLFLFPPAAASGLWELSEETGFGEIISHLKHKRRITQTLKSNTTKERP